MNKKNIYDVWFPKATKEITIIISEEAASKKSEDAVTTSENYAYLDNVGDKDTLFEVIIFLARHYPKAILKRLFPREFNEREDLNKNLVIIGGPAHNEIYSRFRDKCGALIGYNLEYWTISFQDKMYESHYSEEKGMQMDYGSFSSFKNPFMHEHKIILINGISTFGALGAFYAFSDRDEATWNYKYINDHQIDVQVFKGFETLVEVKVYNCNLLDCTKVSVDCPLIEPDNTKIHYSLEEIDKDMQVYNKLVIKEKKDIAIITVLDEETMAVVKMLGLVERKLSLGNRLFYQGDIESKAGKKYSIILTQQLSQGESSVVAAFDSLVLEFNPSFLFLTGIAGGISSDTNYCDVVIANQVIGYDLAKDTEVGIIRRGDVYRIDPVLVPLIQQTIHRASISPFQAAEGSKNPVIDIRYGSIASGSVVVANSFSNICEWIKNFNDKTYAVEMEGYGFNVASYEQKLNGAINKHCTACVIRGISDLADKKKASVKKYRKPAAENAAIVLREIISNIP